MRRIISKFKGKLKREIKVPGDKSISHRSIIFGSIAKGVTEVSNFLTGEDCICTRKAFEALGVKIEFDAGKNNLMKIYGQGMSQLQAPARDIYLGNSGTAMRLLAGLFAGLPFRAVLTGDESLSRRPMKRILDPLEMMGANVESNDGKAPLIINQSVNKGHKLKGINYQSPIASAQVKSCILLAGLNAEGITSVTEPYKSRDHTERMLQSFGVDIKIASSLVAPRNDICNPNNNVTTVAIDGYNAAAILQGQKFNIPSDISSAAFFMVAAAILPEAEITLKNIGVNITRTGILDVMRAMNVNFKINNERLEGNEPVADIVTQSSNIKSMTIEGDIIPRLIDEIPVIAVLASQASGTTVIKNAEELKVKESNRITTTVNMLRILGVSVSETDDGMIIEGRAGKPFEPKQMIIDSKGDHRIAMSSAIAALHSNIDVEILQTEFVETSFPGFFDLLPGGSVK